MADSTPSADVWSDWLLHRRHGDDRATGAQVDADVLRFADHLLERAALGPDMTLVDVGSGQGVVALRAIERAGPSLRVILTDISAPLLAHARQRALDLGVSAQCTLIECPADDLGAIADASVDVVTTRAVLAYVADKRAALAEFHRILKPGGRISLAEPVFQDDAIETTVLRNMVNARPADAPDRVLPLILRWKAAQFPDTAAAMARNPLSNYSERDLLRLARDAGFLEAQLELHIAVRRSTTASWEVLLGTSPHPLAPSLGDVMREQFSAEERDILEASMRPLVESGQTFGVERIAYLVASKPAT
jgi:ubiquinone/menaquinone biosynthesis C-methylase UbiE